MSASKSTGASAVDVDALCRRLGAFGAILFGNDNCETSDKQRAVLGRRLDEHVHYVAVRAK